MVTNKLLLGLAAGAASLALVGVGAGAAFTSTATVGAQATTGSVSLTASAFSCASGFCSDPTTSQQSTYTSDGTTTDWAISTTAPTNGVAMAPLSNIGSNFTGNIKGSLLNAGSLSLQTLGLTVTDSSANAALDAATLVTITMTTDGASPQTATITTAGETLQGLITASASGAIPITLGTPLAVAGGYTFAITLSSPAGGYSNSLQGEGPSGLTTTHNMAPVFSFTGSDV